MLLGSLLALFLMIVPGVAVWLWGGYDAYRTAKRMNEGLVPYRETNPLMIVGFIIVRVVTAICVEIEELTGKASGYTEAEVRRLLAGDRRVCDPGGGERPVISRGERGLL